MTDHKHTVHFTIDGSITITASTPKIAEERTRILLHAMLQEEDASMDTFRVRCIGHDGNRSTHRINRIVHRRLHMIRIVKSGLKAEWSPCHGTLLHEHQTVLIDKNWRPEHYIDQKEIILGCNFCDKSKVDCHACQCNIGFKAGFQACLEAIERKAMEKV